MCKSMSEPVKQHSANSNCKCVQCDVTTCRLNGWSLVVPGMTLRSLMRSTASYMSLTSRLWLKPPLENAGLGYRRNHMAACHNESLIVLGGQPLHSLLPVVSADCLCKLP